MMTRLFFKITHGTKITRYFPALSIDVITRYMTKESDELEKSKHRKKPKLGIANRHLKDATRVYEFNAW